MNPQLYDGRNRDFKTTSHSCAVEPHTDSFLSLLQNKAKRINVFFFLFPLFFCYYKQQPVKRG